MTFAEQLRRLSARTGASPTAGGDRPSPWSTPPGSPPAGQGTAAEQGAPRVPYAELHCHSHFSFLDGVAAPEELVEEAARLGLEAIVLTDHDGMSGAVRFAQAGRRAGLRTGHGAELSLGLPGPQGGVPDPAGTHLLALARDLTGYERLCRVVSRAHLAGPEKGCPRYDLDEVTEELRGHALVLTGCRKGAVRRALVEQGPAAAMTALQGLVGRFGREHVAVELIDWGQPLDSEHNDALAAMAAELALPTVASGNVHLARPEQDRHAWAVAAIRARRTVDELEGWLPAAGAAFLRSGAEMAEAFVRYPGAVARSAALGREVACDLQLLAPQLPPFPVPSGFGDEDDYLRHLAYAGAAERYGAPEDNPRAYATIDRELAIIRGLGFAGYFLVVWDIVRHCRESGILAQGRGSAATSAVCFALRISNVDAVRHNLLFERFLNAERAEPPDIDVDIEAQRREEAIQYVYRRYGRLNAALVANVITYRPRSAVRDAAKALGYSPSQQDAWAKDISRFGSIADAAAAQDPPAAPEDVLECAGWLENSPRHLGVHPGGMVICRTPVSEVVPVERARMADRTVLQWEKDDCAAVGLVKFDLLGLGMLSALHHSIDLVAEHHGRRVDLGELEPTDPAVFDMLCRADAVGLFQVESRAQLNTLPRLQPRAFRDLVVEVALIRPGPIQGGSVHPYIRRHRGEEPVSYDHPLCRNALQRTKGVPLFQEQVMQLARDVAGFSLGEADQLRRAMGSKRSHAQMKALIHRFIDGTDRNRISRDVSKKIFMRMQAFAGFGFPESHSFAFAHLVYASAWFKLYYPSAYFAALLRSQPMGFYSPQTLVADARRHGVAARPPDINASFARAGLEPDPDSTGGFAIRLGLDAVRGLGADVAERIADERAAAGPYTSIGNLTDRLALPRPVVEALAHAGAFTTLGPDRRQALWTAGAAAATRPEHLPGLAIGHPAPALPGMTQFELVAADLATTGITTDRHPVSMIRDRLARLGAIPADRVPFAEPGSRIRVGGAVTHLQRPPSAHGVAFLNLEDETGLLNVIVSPGLFQRTRKLLTGSPAVLVRGLAQVAQGAFSLQADQITPLDLNLALASRHFR